ncbi:hypothetical protein [Roseateles sp. P5_E7]
MQFQQRVARFAPEYVADWEAWIQTPTAGRPRQLGEILRRWQACRPNPMRRTRLDAAHDYPFLEDLIELSETHFLRLVAFKISDAHAFTPPVCESLRALWVIFQQLSYGGKVRSGLAGAVGISKAVMLLTDGRVGPAFDSEVRRHLGVGRIDTAEQWLEALREASRDIRAFEAANGDSIANCVPHFSHLHIGRIYDMALGPG